MVRIGNISEQPTAIVPPQEGNGRERRTAEFFNSRIFPDGESTPPTQSLQSRVPPTPRKNTHKDDYEGLTVPIKWLD